MKILVTGSNGQLGNSLRREFGKDPEIVAVYTDVDTLDITDAHAVERFMAEGRFDLVVNCAAYTAVDKAESDELKAAALNTNAVGHLARAAAKTRTRVIHISTDYVFSGQSHRPYEEKDEPYPASIYGRTKLEGEALLSSFCPDAIIIRTAWLYSEYGSNFVKTILRLAEEKDSLRIVSDQIGTPTYAGDLAKAIHTVAKSKDAKPGIFHFSNEGAASWFDFAKAILEFAGIGKSVEPINTSDYPTAAKRPLYSVLSKNRIKKAYGLRIPYWRDSLRECVATLTSSK